MSRATGKPQNVESDVDDDSDSDSSEVDEEISEEEKNLAGVRGITEKNLKRHVEAQETAEKNLFKVVKSYRRMPTMRMTMGQRRFLFFWHLAVILASVSLVSAGGFLTYYIDDFLWDRVDRLTRTGYYHRFVRLKERPKVSAFYGKIVAEHGNALIGLGLIYLIITFFYISFLGHRFQFTWPILSLINIIALLLELSNLLVRLAPTAQMSSNQKTHLQEAIMKNYRVKSADEFSVAYDFISIWGKCCGISSMYDFQNAKFDFQDVYHGERKEYKLQAPAVCCKRGKFSGVEPVLDCAKKLFDTYERGCFNLLFDQIQTYEVIYIFVIGFYIMDIVVHISIYRDMLRRLEPLLGIDSLDLLEAIREVENERLLTGK